MLGGGKGGINALNSMRTVARGVYANAIPKQVVLDGLHVQDGELGEDAKPLIHDVVKELKAYMSVYKEVKKTTRSGMICPHFIMILACITF